VPEAGDDGLTDEALAAALATGSRTRVVAALAGARVFAAVSATSTAEELGAHGVRQESSAEMAVLLLEVDGARALPVFPSVPALLAWSKDARPVPLSGTDACRAALDEGAEALVLDPGAGAWTLGADELESLAAGYVPVTGTALASRHADVQLAEPAVPPDEGLLLALREALEPERLRDARLLQGPDGPVLGVTARRPLGAPGLAALAQRVMTRLGDRLPAAGLDVAEVGPGTPGVPLLARKWLRRGR
jgi:hypothetical protein